MKDTKTTKKNKVSAQPAQAQGAEAMGLMLDPCGLFSGPPVRPQSPPVIPFWPYLVRRQMRERGDV